MKIAVLVSNPCVIDARVMRMSEAEAKLGNEVKIFATLKGDVLEKEEKNEVYYERIFWDLSKYCRQFIPRFIKYKKLKSFFVKRMAKYLRYYSFRETFLEDVMHFQPDIVHAHDLVCLPLGAKVKELTGAKLIYDAHELEVYRNPPLPWQEKLFTKFIEQKYSKNADCVITVNDSIANILKQNLSVQNVYSIRNTPIINLYRGKSLREKLNFSKKEKILLYVGKVSSNRGLEWVIENLQEMPDIHFVCVGHQDKQMSKQLQEQVQNLNVENRFHILEPVPHEQVVEFIKDADVGICAINPVTKSYYYSLPNKAFEMSMAGLPIVATDLPEIRKLLDEIGNGYFFSPEEKHKIPLLVDKIFKEMQEKQNNFADIARKSKAYSWANESKKIQEVLANITPLKSEEK